MEVAAPRRVGGGIAGTTNPRGRGEEKTEGTVLGGAGGSEAERGRRGRRGRRTTLRLPALRAGHDVRGQQLQPDPKPGHPRHSPGGSQ